MLIGFDHFIILVNNLDAAMESFRRLGFEVQPGGEHPAFGSRNAIVALADGSYFELVAFKDPALAAKGFWAEAYKRLMSGEGFGGFALASDDLIVDSANIRASGIPITDPQPGSRMRPDGRQISWRTALVGDTPSGMMPFLIQDETARSLRVELPHDGLGSRAHAVDVLVAVREPESAWREYKALVGGEPRSRADNNAHSLTLPWGSITFAGPDMDEGGLAAHLRQRGEGLYAVTLAVEDAPAHAGFPRKLACGALIRIVQRKRS